MTRYQSEFPYLALDQGPTSSSASSLLRSQLGRNRLHPKKVARRCSSFRAMRTTDSNAWHLRRFLHPSCTQRDAIQLTRLTGTGCIVSPRTPHEQRRGTLQSLKLRPRAVLVESPGSLFGKTIWHPESVSEWRAWHILKGGPSTSAQRRRESFTSWPAMILAEGAFRLQPGSETRIRWKNDSGTRGVTRGFDTYTRVRESRNLKNEWVLTNFFLISGEIGVCNALYRYM